MRTGSLRRRTVIATLAVLVLTLGTFAILVTVRYRDGLRQQARSHLVAGARAVRTTIAGAAAVRATTSKTTAKEQLASVIGSLTLEGISVKIGRPELPARDWRGPGVLHSGSRLLTYSEPVRINNKVLTAKLSSSEASLHDAVSHLIVTELIGAAIALAAAAVLTWLALRSALAPLRQVAVVAQRIARGDRSQRLHPRRPESELGRMAASFDAMVDSLNEAVDQATRSEAAMRRFLADASHELRTPVAALQATAETLLRQQPERPERDRLEAQLARGSQRLGRLVNDLLNLARLEAKEPLRSGPVDLAATSQGLVDDARKRTSAQISVTADRAATVLGDPGALARALTNVLENAVRASGEHGEIQVDVRRSPARVAVTVSDNGPGVPREEHERIFDEFVTLNGGSSTGTGLGLAISRAIAHQHGGEITCEHADAGARFTLELPAADTSSCE